jgi:hypothetical protein
MRFAANTRAGNRKSKIVRAACAAVALLLLSSCGGQTMAPIVGGPPLSPSATISFCDDGVEGCVAASTFSVAVVRDLVIKVSWQNVPPGNHVQGMEIMLPGGGLYQSNQTGIFIADAAPGSATTTRILPVGGTWISQRQLTGEWSVNASLDGQPRASQMVQFNP